MEHSPHDVGGRPTVGNVLGFSLLLRDRRALLRLERRALAPGLRVADYEAEIPGIEFPMRAQSASGFRGRRCKARQLRLEVEPHALVTWLRGHLVGKTIAGLRVDEVELELAARPEPELPSGLGLYVSGRHEGRRAWVLLAVQVLPRGRALGLRTWRRWLVGEATIDPAALWDEIAVRLGATPDRRAPELWTMDPVRTVLLRPFVTAGWRTPDLSELVIEGLDLTPRRGTLALVGHDRRIGAAPVPRELPRQTDRVAERLDAIRDAIAQGQRATAATELERLTEMLAPEHPARLAMLRWLTELTAAAGHDAGQHLRALKAWLHRAPRDLDAERALVLTLGRSGNDRALAQRLAAQCRLPHPPRTQARLELALATVLVDRLDELAAARELLELLLERCASDPTLKDLELPARACLARARADAPAHALAELQRAMILAERGLARASVQAGVAAALARRGHDRVAAPVWGAAVRRAPDDPVLVDDAIASLERADDAALMIELLRLAIPHAQAGPSTERALALRRRLVDTLLERGDATSHELGLAELRALVRDEPQDRELALRLSSLEQHGGRPEEAAAVLARLAEASDDPEERTRLRLEQARLLTQADQPRRAWTVLAPALEDAPESLEATLLELAISIAPLSSRDALIDRFVEIDQGPRSGAALLARARERRSEPERRVDLERAAERLEDPRPALRALTELAQAGERAPWLDLADACARLEDVDGEREARIELALRALHDDELDEARQALERAAELVPQDRAIAIARAWVEARAERFAAAAERLGPLAQARLDVEAPWLEDARLGLPIEVVRRRAAFGEVMFRAGHPAEAATLLVPAIESLGVEALPHHAETLVEALEALERHAEASAHARRVADLHEGSRRADWLARAARHAAPADAVVWLTEAIAVRPDDITLVTALERAARASGDEPSLDTALRRTARHPELPPDDRARALRDLLARHEPETDAPHRDPANDPELVTLYEQLLAVDEDDGDALLVVGTRSWRQGDEERALSLWTRALQVLPADDPRRVEPSVALARHALERDDPSTARDRLESVLALPGLPLEAYALLADAAEALGDSETRIRALLGTLEHAEDGPIIHETSLRLARQLDAGGHTSEAIEHAARATRGMDPGSPEHIDAARLWLDLATRVDDPRAQADARLELRRGLGSDLPPKELRAEALLLAERLGRDDDAQAVIEQALEVHPHDELLLSTLKHLGARRGALDTYLAALDAAVEGMEPGLDRDRMVIELARSAAHIGDAPRVHRALGRLSTSLGDEDEELLDLHEWSVRSLGIEDQELRRIDERLRAGAIDAGLLARLARLVGDGEPSLEHLLALIRDVDELAAQRLLAPALAVAEMLPACHWMIRVLRNALRVQALDFAQRAWPGLVARVQQEGDEETIAELAALADDAVLAGATVDGRAIELLEDAIARSPASPHLHRALARHIARRATTDRSDAAQREAELAQRLQTIAERHGLSGRQRAELLVGMVEPLDRRAAADLLTAQAERWLHDPAAFGRLLEALETRQCWPEVLRLLGARVEVVEQADDKVALLKHLAHVASEVLGDPPAAVRHLEAALELAPTDPDLLLPLLEHHFTQTDLRRAVELTERVLEHVRMGDAAFAALAHRAADAAIAQGQADRAAALLERVTERAPDDEKARTRLAELRSRADEPEPRVELLAAVAARQSGKARIEALEERARLLIDPLDRPEEAMEDLAAVVAEAPDRSQSAELLALLYREHERWSELVALHEAELPRRHGLARARVLQTIAEIHRDSLLDLPRAEQALRLAIEELGTGPDDLELAGALRQTLVDNLERQGRYVDLSVYLEQELAPELDPMGENRTPAPPRLALLQTLARLLRDRLDDEDRSARIYEHLERWNALPDDGLATLARWYRRRHRHDDLVRVLQIRATALAEFSERRAAVDLRIAELLDGPLARPHDAAPYYLEAYLADPEANTDAGARARVLLSAVDSVVNVRDRLERRLESVDPSRRPALLTLLADVLAPHEAHEKDAEASFREALRLQPGLAAAQEGLGRLLARLGRRGEAADALVAAADNDALAPTRAAESAALAARNLVALDRFDDAEAVLERALRRHPESQRALLELARLYERRERGDELSKVLDRLAQLPLSSAMMAEVAYRRALLLRSVYELVPGGPQGERARSYLLEALGANPRHAAARRALLELATRRREWSIVAHMHYLAIRELPPGPPRAVVHLDLASTYLDHLHDPDSAMRNIESALQQAATDVVIANRTGELARRLPDRRAAAERFESIASSDVELDDPAKARLWLLAADLRMEDDDHAAAQAATRRVLDLPAVPGDASAAATRTLERLEPRDPESLAATRTGLLARLDEQPPPLPPERARLLGRLHDVGLALDDAGLVERASREQLALAADLDETDDHATTTGAVLRDLLAARGEYRPLVELYERLASQTGGEDPRRAAEVLVEAAGYAWRGLGEPEHAATLLARALGHRPDDDTAAHMLDALIQETTDAAAAEALYRALATLPIDGAVPAVRLSLATLAVVRRAEDEALALLRPLTAASIPVPTRLRALARLESILAGRGEHGERRRVLADLFTLAQKQPDDADDADVLPRIGDLGLELARLQHADGDRAAARQTVQAARRLSPDHRTLLQLATTLAEQDEDWSAVIPLYEELAELAVDDTEQSRWLTAAARVYLDHPELEHGAADGPQQARRLLLRAAEIAPMHAEPRVALLPLSFRQGRWDEVLELGEAIAQQTGHDEEVLILAALAEGYRRGDLRYARDIGFRHGAEATRRWLLPHLQLLLTEVALRGPLPRLDALLTVGVTLLGGRRHLFEALHGFATERPAEPGLMLALARLYEAKGLADMARHHYQLAAFLAPRGPIPALVERLPRVRVRDSELHALATSPLEEGRGALRELLASLREHLSGLGLKGAPMPAPAHVRSPDWWRHRVELAETIVEPWRLQLGLDLPLSWTEDPLPRGLAVRNDRPPGLVLGRASATFALPELSFRLAYGAATVAAGLAILDGGSMGLVALLDALAQLANPAHEPTGPQAQALADVLAARHAHELGLRSNQRSALLEELAHWLTTDQGPQRLYTALHRMRLVLATRLSGHLDGALLAIARDDGLLRSGPLDATAVLRQPDADWLLRALSLR